MSRSRGATTTGFGLRSGEPIDSDRLRLRGVENPDALAGSRLVAGWSYRVDPTGGTVRVVWSEDALDGVSYTFRTFDLNPGGAVGGFPGGVVSTGSGGDVIAVAGEGGAVTTVVDSSTVSGLGGPGGNVTGDGDADLPFVTAGGEVTVVDGAGDVTTVADSGDVPGSIETDETRLAVGRWQGSPVSVFFVDDNHDTVYRATPRGRRRSSRPPVTARSRSSASVTLTGTTWTSSSSGTGARPSSTSTAVERCGRPASRPARTTVSGPGR